jgi:uncharacterized protein
MATVLEVDIARKRISLSLKDASEKPSGERRAGSGGGQKSFNKKPEPLNSFQAKLMELKKNFKD